MTFVIDGRPNPDSKEVILQALITAAEDAFGREFTPSEVSVVRAFYDPVAELLAQQQEDLAQVLDSAQIDHAEGGALDLLASLIGVSREPARAANVRLQFRHDDPVTRTYNIPGNTRAQTESTDAVRFETDESTTLPLLDDFEENDLSIYTGDDGDFEIQDGVAYQQDFALRADAADSQIIDADRLVEYGSRFHVRVQGESNTEPAFLFGVEDTDNWYKAVLDTADGEIRLELSEGGSVSTIGTESVSIPTGEWLHLRVDWLPDGEYEIYVEQDDETAVGTLSTSETEPTIIDGGYGFASEDTTGLKYFDMATTSRISVDASATETGGTTNVGSDTVVVMSQAVPGVDEVTNLNAASGGRDQETDEEFRERAKATLSDSLRSTLPALIARLSNVEETRSVTVIDNDENTADADGRPGHSFEAVVDVDSDFYEEVAETILETKAVGDTSVGGFAGSEVTRDIELVNGQTKEIAFSTPTIVTIYVDVTLTKTNEYAGDDQVRDSIVQYTGGTLDSGGNVDGELEAGDDVIYNQVVEAIMDVRGVHDFSDLQVATSDPPSGTSNITIADTEMANADASDDSIAVTSSDV